MKYYSENILQKAYLDAIYSHVDPNIKNKYIFCVISSHPNHIDESIKLLNSFNQNKIIFDLGDEWHRIPEYYSRNDIKIILKEYAPLNFESLNKIIPLPTFYNFVELPQKNIKDKKYFLYTNMWLTPSREKVKKILEKYEDNIDCKIVWNTEFGKGLPLKDYLNDMINSIVTICPDGYMSSEVSKLGEALICGNIILCSERINYPYYENNAFFVYKNVTEIPYLLDKIKSLTILELEDIIDKNNKLYQNSYSPEAIAKIINKTL